MLVKSANSTLKVAGQNSDIVAFADSLPYMCSSRDSKSFEGADMIRNGAHAFVYYSKLLLRFTEYNRGQAAEN